MTDITSELEAIKKIVNELIKFKDPKIKRRILEYAARATIKEDLENSDSIESNKYVDNVLTINPKIKSLGDFINEKNPSNNYQLITCIGYYLENYKQKEKGFNSKDIARAVNEARLPPITNLSRDVKNTQHQYQFIITSHEDKKLKKLSQNGIALVKTLPDQKEIRKIVSRARMAINKKSKRKNTQGPRVQKPKEDPSLLDESDKNEND